MSGRLHIHPGPSVVIREGSAGERWCFDCRKRAEHTWQAMADRHLSYYEPIWVCRCSRCKHDRTSFPGFEGWTGGPEDVERDTHPTAELRGEGLEWVPYGEDVER